MPKLRKKQDVRNIERSRLQALLETSPSGIVIIEKPDGHVSFVNDQAKKIFGMNIYSTIKERPEKIRILKPDHTVYRPEETPATRTLMTGETVTGEEMILPRPDGSEIYISVNTSPLFNEDGEVESVITVFEDITAKKEYEKQIKDQAVNLRRLIKTLKAMQKSSQLIASVKDEKEFLQQVCNIIIGDCGHDMIWIGYKMNDASKTILPVAVSGSGTSYLDNLKVTWADTPRGHGPAGTAIRTGKISLFRDMLNDPDFHPWKKEAQKRGFTSSVGLPLYIDDEVFGVMVIYSQHIDSFSPEENQLLMKLADDLSFGIKAIRMNQDLKQAKDDLEVKVEKRTELLKKTLNDLDAERQRVTDLLNIIPAFVVVVSKKGEIRFANRIFEKEFGDINNFEYDFFASRAEIAKVFETNRPLDWEWNAPNGRSYQVSAFPFTETDGTEVTLEMGIDITEKKNIEKYVLRKILETEEKERRRFASDLHDDLGPTLSAIKLQLSLLAQEVSTEPKRELLKICDDLLTDGIDKMKNIANSIMPNLLNDYGLETATKSFLEKAAKASNMEVDFKSGMKGYRFDEESELHLYRIITELIANTIKHSGASQISVALLIDNSDFRLEYSDNGIGYTFMPYSQESTGIGLQNIQNRCKLINATMETINDNGKTKMIIRKSLPNKKS